MIKAILFDLDETLIEDESVSLAAFRAAAGLAAEQLHLDAALLAKAAGLAARRLWQESPFFAYCNRIGHSAWEGLWAPYETGANPAIGGLRDWTPGYRIAVWREALAEQGVAAAGAASPATESPANPAAGSPTVDSLAAAMAVQFIAARCRYPIYPEVEPLLERLRGAYKLGIVTNGVPGLQRQKINGCGLLPLFDASVVSGEIDCGKPDPGIFQHIARELGVAPAEMVMVGDNPARDVAGATAAGCKSVWVQRGGRQRDERYPADLECTDLSALADWLDRGAK